MTSLLQLLLLLITIITVNCQVSTNGTDTNTTWPGCTDPNNPTVKVGSPTTICLVVSQGGNWSNGMTYRRWVFQPTADEYSHMTVSKSYLDLVITDAGSFQPEVSVHVESQQSVSFIRRFFSLEGGTIFPYLTAIINVDQGNVIGITWDDACVFCAYNRCIENTYFFNSQPAIGGSSKGCYFTKDECDALSTEKKPDCLLNVYFVWTGTDVDGRILTSSNKRYSAFQGVKIPWPTIPTLNDVKGMFGLGSD